MGTAITGSGPRITEEYVALVQSQLTTWEDAYRWYGKVVWNDGE